ncbi:MAG: transcriptional regulator, AraC family [Bacteroidetes bacterium]|nr:transcriptional regulator, AraC family [Bacteroidota bacterium]
MKLYIKNMVCNRCSILVKAELEKQGLHILSVSLGEAEIQGSISLSKQKVLEANLSIYGFELIQDKNGQLIEKIKNTVVELIHHSTEDINTTYSVYISRKLNHDYSYLSKLFSESNGMTLEQYIIAQKIEKVKELIVYDELSLGDIAHKMHYSSIAHLSRQFKSITGFTPSAFKKLKHNLRKSIEEI